MKNDIFEKTIKTYLDGIAEKDPSFAEKYGAEGKSIADCCQYIISEVKKKYKGKDAVCSDEYVFGLAIHYYDEANLKVTGNTSAHVVVSRQLTDEEKDKARKEAEIQFRKEKEDAVNRAKEEIRKYEPEYQERIRPFAGIVIHAGDIDIRPIMTVKDVFFEGKEMHHCVFINEYWKKKDVLLMSAKNGKGERVETIEVNISRMEVIQSRGRCNALTDFHDHIVSTVNSHMGEILSRKKFVNAI